MALIHSFRFELAVARKRSDVLDELQKIENKTALLCQKYGVPYSREFEMESGNIVPTVLNSFNSSFNSIVFKRRVEQLRKQASLLVKKRDRYLKIMQERSLEQDVKGAFYNFSSQSWCRISNESK